MKPNGLWVIAAAQDALAALRAAETEGPALLARLRAAVRGRDLGHREQKRRAQT